MAGVTAQGATFSFGGFAGKVTGVSVESPTAEVVDMSGIQHSASQIVMVPTGSWSGGTVTVDFVGYGDPTSLVRRVGPLTFASDGLSLSRQVICQSASVQARAGEIVSGSLRFMVTDYLG